MSLDGIKAARMVAYFTRANELLVEARAIDPEAFDAFMATIEAGNQVRLEAPPPPTVRDPEPVIGNFNEGEDPIDADPLGAMTRSTGYR